MFSCSSIGPASFLSELFGTRSWLVGIGEWCFGGDGRAVIT